MSKRVLVTGANGGIGKALCHHLEQSGYEIFRGLRSQDASTESNALVYGDITQPIAFHEPLDAVVHCAGLAHQTTKDNQNFFAVNVEGTKHVIRAARLAGIKRFVYFSSTKVLGGSAVNETLSEQSPTNPLDAYSKSKLEAEQFVTQYAKQYGLEVVIIRPPLVVGLDKDVGNLKSLLALIKKGFPLPFGLVKNKRSLVHIDNLCELTRLCLEQPNAAGEIFHAADADLSTTELANVLAVSHKLKLNVFPFPLVLLKGILTVIGKRDTFEKLTGSFCIQADKAKQLLQWQPDKDVYLHRKPSNLV